MPKYINLIDMKYYISNRIKQIRIRYTSCRQLLRFKFLPCKINLFMQSQCKLFAKRLTNVSLIGSLGMTNTTNSVF